MQDPVLRVHALIARSRANGPGLRWTLWLQGCSRGCRDCFNPATHPHEGGQLITVKDLFASVARHRSSIEGVTFTGGEPLEQPAPLVALAERIRRETSLSTLLFTGFTWNELEKLPAAPALLPSLDVVVAGPYESTRRLGGDLRGSDNQTVHFVTDRYGPADLEKTPPAEIVVTPGGEVLLSGSTPPELTPGAVTRT